RPRGGGAASPPTAPISSSATSALTKSTPSIWTYLSSRVLYAYTFTSGFSCILPSPLAVHTLGGPPLTLPALGAPNLAVRQPRLAQMGFLNVPWPHISIGEFLAIENERMIPVMTYGFPSWMLPVRSRSAAPG